MNKFVSKYMPRWLNCIYATLNGYFWLECSGCNKRYFGGHESSGYIESNATGGFGVCPWCVKNNPRAIKY